MMLSGWAFTLLGGGRMLYAAAALGEGVCGCLGVRAAKSR